MIKKILLIFLFFFCLSSVKVLAQSGNSYYVATNGSDSNPGTLSQPFRTLRKGAGVLRAGDTLYVRAGTYQEYFTISANGTESNPIRISNYNGEVVIIDGNNNNIPNRGLDGVGMINISGDWVTVSNLTVAYSGSYGIISDGMYDMVDNVYIHHSWGAGIILQGDYNTAQNSRSWYNGTMNEGGTMSISWPTGISCARHPSHCTIRKCTSWETWGEGLSTFEATYTTIEDSISHDNWSVDIYVSDTTNTLVQRNFIYNTPNSAVQSGSRIGIMVADEKYNPPSSANKVINNIVFGTRINFHWWTTSRNNGMPNTLVADNTFVNSNILGTLLINGPHDSSNRFMNNLVVQEGSLPLFIEFDCAGCPQFANNLWSKTPPSKANGSNDIVGDSGMVRTGDQYSAGWFRLLPTSIAINKARILAEVPGDYYQVVRGITPDIGAIEYTGSSQNPTPTPIPTGSYLISDVNRDGRVNSSDANLIFVSWLTGGTTIYHNREDIVKDGKVNSLDFGLVMRDWGRQ